MGLKRGLILRLAITYFFLFTGLLYGKSDVSFYQSENWYVHTILNQPKYIAGDSVWMKIYLTDINNRRISGSYRLHLYLMDSVSSEKYFGLYVVNDGIGFTQFVLPDKLSAGVYWVVSVLDGLLEEEATLFKKKIIIASESNTVKSRVPILDDSKRLNFSLNSQVSNRETVRLELLSDSVEAEVSISVYNADLLGPNSDSFSDAVAKAYLRDGAKVNIAHTRTLEQTNRQRKGRVLFADSGIPVPDSTLVYLYLQKSKWRYQTSTMTDGWVTVFIPDFYLEDDFFYLAEVQGVVVSNIEIKWAVHDISINEEPEQTLVSGQDEYALYRKKQGMIEKSYSSYKHQDSVINVYKSINQKFFIEPNESVRIDDYVEFPTMVEYIKEIIPSLYYRVRHGKSIIRVKLQPIGNIPAELPKSDPIYIIDGIVSNNSDYFISLRPNEVNTIGVVTDPRKLRPLGLLGKAGIVIVETKTKQKFPKPEKETFRLHGIMKPLTYSSSNLANSMTFFPDFRSVLYWNPSITLKKKSIVEFATSDDEGEFVIEMNGFHNGTPFTQHLRFTLQ